MKLTTLLLSSVLLASTAFGATTLTFSFDSVTEVGVLAPSGTAPWATATFTQLTPTAVSMVLSSNLSGSEFFSKFAFNLNPTLDLSHLTVVNTSSSGSFALPSVTLGVNSQGGGQGTRFDIAFNFNTSNSGGGVKRFNFNDSVAYTFTYNGSGDFTLDSFNVLDASGQQYVIAHAQGLCSSSASAWISNTTVPEPKAALLGALGLITLLRRRR